MSLHNEIMNIQCESNDILTYQHGHDHKHSSYKLGHRDARHAAAELSMKQEALIEKLLDALEARNADDYVDRIRQEYSL